MMEMWITGTAHPSPIIVDCFLSRNGQWSAVEGGRATAVPLRRSTDPASSSDDSLVAGSTSRYTPFGSWRTEPTANLTDWGFTGHMHHNLGSGAEDIGLVYMAARWYAPTLCRFLSADTIVPNPANPQSYNRYSYVENRLLVFTDPTGHRPSDGCETESCMSDQHTWGQNFVAQMAQKDDRFHTAVTALYEDYQTRFGEVIDVPQGSSVEYTLWHMAYEDTTAIDAAIKQGSWLTNAIRDAFGGGDLDPFDIIEGSIGVILTVSNDSVDDEYGPAGFGPTDIQLTINRIQSGGTYPHRNDGTAFRNDDGLLPAQPYGYYTEYVHPTLGIRHAGPQRVVTGKGGEVYYTPNHYGRFIRVK